MRSVAVLGLGGGFASGVRAGGGQVYTVVENGFGEPLVRANLPEVTYQRFDRGTSLAYGDADFQFGCPPCAGWSTASAGLDRKDNPDHPINDGIRTWFAAVEENRPAIACYESVVGHLKRGRALWHPLARRLEERGYRWCFVVYDNRQVGVPQRRERMLFWAWRTGGVFSPEEPLGDRTITCQEALGSYGSVDDPWWAWEELNPDKQAVHRLLPYVYCGSNVRQVPTELWLEHYQESGVREGWPSFTYRRLHPHRPAPVLMANAVSTTMHFDDPTYPRGDEPNLEPNPNCRLLMGREIAVLMGYPHDFVLNWKGTPKATKREREQLSAWLTQAVSPRVGMWAARCASAHLEDHPLVPDSMWEPFVWDMRSGTPLPTPLDTWAPL